MSLLDKNGDHIVTLDGIWSLLLKIALVSLPICAGCFVGFVTWVVLTIGALQTQQAVTAAYVTQLLTARH